MPPVESFRGQRYKDLKKRLMSESKLFTDPEFPPHETSLVHSAPAYSGIEWKRPGEIVSDPHLFVEGVSSDDVTQGVLGNCWFVAACSVLTHHSSLWTRVIPDSKDQEWDSSQPHGYCGIFHFCFWQFGHWIDVVIDDLLPTQNGHLIFARSKTRNEFWSALLEKAFAKLHGCYEALIGGSLAEAFVDITGGVPETIDLSNTEWRTSEARVRLFDELKQYYDESALMATAIAAKSQNEVEEGLECGLVKGHSYAITDVRELALDAEMQGLLDRLLKTPEKVLMVRLRNPWGEKEWNGAWSDGAKEWQMISEPQRQKLGLKIEEDGEFWMTFDDFCHYFTDISMCHQVNTSWFSLSKSYYEHIFSGVWSADHSKGHLSNRAGGCVNFRDTFLQNPQYRFDVPEDSNESIMLSLMQRDVRERKKQGIKYLTIGMHAMKVEDNRKYRLHQIQKGAGTSEYVNTRSVFLRLKNQKPGRYVVVPTTFAPGDEGEFMLRMYTSFNPSPVELKKENPSSGPCRCVCKKPPRCVTKVIVISASTLQKEDRWGSVDPYVIINCEGKKMTSYPAKDTYNPKWDFSAIFFRRKPEKQIQIDIYNKNVLTDSHMGCVLLSAPINNESKRFEIPLREAGKANNPGAVKSGKLTVDVATYEDPLYL